MVLLICIVTLRGVSKMLCVLIDVNGILWKTLQSEP